jgi:hypothetical protein
LTARNRATLLKRWEAAVTSGRLAGKGAAEDAYLAGLPRAAIARCPFTDAVVTHTLDTFGIDGPWWNYVEPVRPIDEGLPPTVFALSGALHVGDAPPATSFLVKGGPEVPFVVPRILELAAVRAVVSLVTVGDLTGYPITYFADPMVHGVPRVNSWGSNLYWFRDADGQWGWSKNYEDQEVLDFDLAKWIDAGKLQWIAPDDDTFALRDDIEGCDYLELPGRRMFVRTQFGQTWEPTTVA